MVWSVWVTSVSCLWQVALWWCGQCGWPGSVVCDRWLCDGVVSGWPGSVVCDRWLCDGMVSVDDQGQLFVTGGSVMVWSVWMTRVNCLWQVALWWYGQCGWPGSIVCDRWLCDGVVSVDDQGQLFVTGGSVMVWSVWMTRVNCLWQVALWWCGQCEWPGSVVCDRWLCDGVVSVDNQGQLFVTGGSVTVWWVWMTRVCCLWQVALWWCGQCEWPGSVVCDRWLCDGVVSVDDQGQLFMTGGSVMVWSVWMTRVSCLWWCDQFGWPGSVVYDRWLCDGVVSVNDQSQLFVMVWSVWMTRVSCLWQVALWWCGQCGWPGSVVCDRWLCDGVVSVNDQGQLFVTGGSVMVWSVWMTRASCLWWCGQFGWPGSVVYDRWLCDGVVSVDDQGQLLVMVWSVWMTRVSCLWQVALWWCGQCGWPGSVVCDGVVSVDDQGQLFVMVWSVWMTRVSCLWWCGQCGWPGSVVYDRGLCDGVVSVDDQGQLFVTGGSVTVWSVWMTRVSCLWQVALWWCGQCGWTGWVVYDRWLCDGVVSVDDQGQLLVMVWSVWMTRVSCLWQVALWWCGQCGWSGSVVCDGVVSVDDQGQLFVMVWSVWMTRVSCLWQVALWWCGQCEWPGSVVCDGVVSVDDQGQLFVIGGSVTVWSVWMTRVNCLWQVALWWCGQCEWPESVVCDGVVSLDDQGQLFMTGGSVMVWSVWMTRVSCLW